MSITTALSARRDALRDREAGFTLIELLVVVLIIGILAAIAIPVYLGVQNSAKDAGAKSDLVNAKTALTALSADNSGAAITAFTTNNSKTALTATATPSGGTAKDIVAYGFSESANTSSIGFTLGSGANVNKWCLLATSATTNKFFITSDGSVGGGTPTTTCPAAY